MGITRRASRTHIVHLALRSQPLLSSSVIGFIALCVGAPPPPGPFDVGVQSDGLDSLKGRHRGAGAESQCSLVFVGVMWACQPGGGDGVGRGDGGRYGFLRALFPVKQNEYDKRN